MSLQGFGLIKPGSITDAAFDNFLWVVLGTDASGIFGKGSSMGKTCFAGMPAPLDDLWAGFGTSGGVDDNADRISSIYERNLSSLRKLR